MKRMVSEALVELIAQNKEELIIRAVKETVRNEFKLQIVPVLLTNMRNRIDQEMTLRSGKVDAHLDDFNTSITKIRDVLYNISILINDILS